MALSLDRIILNLVWNLVITLSKYIKLPTMVVSTNRLLTMCQFFHVFYKFYTISSQYLPKCHQLSALNSWTNWTQNSFYYSSTQPFNGFSWNFRVFYLVCLIVPYLFSYCRTAPKQLNQLNSNLFQLLLLNVQQYELTFSESTSYHYW